MGSHFNIYSHYLQIQEQHTIFVFDPPQIELLQEHPTFR